MATVPATDELQGTRQLLDELDALMDQMLALPVNDGQADADPTAPAPTPTVSATLTLLEPSGGYRTTEEPPPPNRGYVLPEPLAVVAAPPIVQLDALPCVEPARWRPSQIAYQFLVWVNYGFDRGAARFGLLGRCLRSRPGRMMLGFAGLTLLALALAWLCRDLWGWNS
jgi:hypothetical protein